MRYLLTRIVFILTAIALSACDDRPDNLALGTLERDRIAHTATTNEIVTALPVPQGSIVSVGTVLVKLNDALQKTLVHKNEAEVIQAQATLEKLRNGARKEELAAASANVSGARAELTASEANYQRLLNLALQKAISESDLDDALAQRETHLASLQNAQEKLRELTNGTREEDLRIAEAGLAVANASLAHELQKLSDLTIIATRDGILDNLPWNLGERVTTGSPLAIVLAGKAPFARVYIPEPYRVKIKVGDTLAVYVDGIEKPINGTIRWLATEPAFTPYYALNQTERARLMYLAEVQLPDSEAHLPNGVPAQVALP